MQTDGQLNTDKKYDIRWNFTDKSEGEVYSGPRSGRADPQYIVLIYMDASHSNGFLGILWY